MVPNARFTELLEDIEPSSTTKSSASSAHTGVRYHLQGHKTFKDRWIESFLSGSYARDTSIRPKSSNGNQERPDIDIIVVTNFTKDDAPDDVLQEVHDALKDGYGDKVKRINKRSVRLETSQADMDGVPLIEFGNEYLIPDRNTGGWTVTNPPVHKSWSEEQNKIFGDRFKPLVKLLKWWRRENPTSKRPKGFVLEVLVSLHAPQDETHFGEAFAILLENIYEYYSLLDQKPSIEDPAVPGNDILAKVTVSQWKEFLEKVRVHAGYARRAQNEEDMEEATCLWRKVFGDRFKKTENAAKAISYTSFAVATTPTAGYTFPKATPPAKPRGFA
ncbi:MAG: nucleotidyltransferase [Chloroflexota bacterium]|nr:nucleotidyltransferase [Chloroflexota bacterium]